ncbi:cytidylate kinase [Cenarchaeum symbiosum A]|uniref:Cytidylate kinase n=1 Tax=Cenarchaeum symbiosum (strain A) TaxID=414004 RepID=A0RUE1_CENSY|nr:cytidylate kinase [Cenarchaeum symbiosum A]
MRSVVISGPPAVGKTTVARALAGEFGLEYLSGGDVLKGIAREEGFDSGGDDWWDTEEGMRFLDKRSKNPEFDRRVDDSLRALFDEGGKVITSYTLPWLVDDGIKIWLAGSHENSSRRMGSRDSIGMAEALAITRRRYLANKVLYKKMYDFEFGEDSSIFNVVINTDNLDADQVIQSAKSQVREML